MTTVQNRRTSALARLAGVSCCALMALAWPVVAQTLALPKGAIRTASVTSPHGSESVALGPWVDGAVQMAEAEGAVSRTAWRIDATSATTMELLASLRDDLKAQGFDVVFECDTDRCGGFDFRYGMDVLPEPDMHVDLGDFRYLAAERKGAGGTEYATLLVSRSATSGYVQWTGVDPSPVTPSDAALSTKSPDPDIVGLDLTDPIADPLTEAPAPTPATPPAPDQIAARIESAGTVALDDLVFASGSANLGDGDFPSLASLAAYLATHPDRRITLVGHTDAVGDLGANIALSKKRAQSVMARLIDRYGVPAAQVDAQGAGFLSPRASNLTDQGRTENRRVEAMLASTR